MQLNQESESKGDKLNSIMSEVEEDLSSQKSAIGEQNSGLPNRSRQSVSMQDIGESRRDLHFALAAHALEVPKLESLEIFGIKQFITKYEEYQIRCPKEYLKSPQFCVRFDHLEVVSVENELEIEELMLLDVEAFWKALTLLHNALSEHEVERRFRRLSMLSDDLRKITLSNYNKAWRWEMLFAGPKIQLPEHFMARIYWEGLRPIQLKEKVGSVVYCVGFS